MKKQWFYIKMSLIIEKQAAQEVEDKSPVLEGKHVW